MTETMTFGCGAEVAAEKSDCWMHHAIRFQPASIDLAERDA